MGGEHPKKEVVTLPEWLLVVDVESLDPAVEDGWNRWYDEVHLPEILACPGFLSGTRYLSAGSRYGAGGRYFTVYELSSSDAIVTEEFLSHRGWSRFEGHLKANVYLLRARGR